MTAVFAGASIQDYLKIIQSAQHFLTRPFGVRAAVETAERVAAAIKAGDKREGEKTEPWEKLKFDRQIIAISLVEGARAIYSTDKHIHGQGERWGLQVIHPADLPVLEVRTEIPFTPKQPEAEAPSDPSDAPQSQEGQG